MMLRITGLLLLVAVCTFPVSAAGNCYAEYSSPDGRKMYTLNVGQKNIEECRKFNWIPFRATFFSHCPECKVDRDTFLDALNEQLKLMVAGKPAGWAYA